MATYTLESLLRPPVELFTTAVCYVAASLCIGAPWAFALTVLHQTRVQVKANNA